MLDARQKYTFSQCAYIAKTYKDIIVILVGREAERLYPLFKNHDVRDCEPYFTKEDNVNWRII